MTFFAEINDNDQKPTPTPAGPAAISAEPDQKTGRILKARRLELGLKFKDIAKDIKIKSEYLKAIEDEEFDLLPTPQYLRLFLKSYAQHLGFDEQEIYGIFDTQEMPIKKPEKKEPLIDNLPPSPLNKIGMKTVIWGGIAAVVMLLLVVIWIFGVGRQDTLPPAEVDTSANESLAGSVADSTPVTAETAISEPEDIPIQPVQQGYRLQIRGRDSTWMVIQSDSDTAFIGFLGPGEVKSWTADSSFKFSLSRREGVEAIINGRYLKPFTQWPGPIQAREVGGFNLERYLDSTRLTENGGGFQDPVEETEAP